jgi:hypothetical protein
VVAVAEAGEDASDRDPGPLERRVVAVALERHVVGPAREVAAERVLDRAAVVDLRLAVRRPHHVEVEVGGDPAAFGVVEAVDVAARADEADLLGAPEREPQREVAAGEPFGDGQQRRDAAGVVVEVSGG